MKTEKIYWMPNIKDCVRTEFNLLLSNPTKSGVAEFIQYLEDLSFDKPDPHVVTSPDERRAKEPQADDEIVKLAKVFAAKLWYDSHPSYIATVAFARLIEAKIEAMRKLFRNHEERIRGIENRGCVTENSGWVEDITEWRKESERKVEELENETHNLEALLEPKAEGPQPQPKGGVALDKEGMPHDPIPGVSIIEFLPEMDKREALFLSPQYHDNPDRVAVVWLTGPAAGQFGSIYHDNFIWLRDLDFPPFAKAQDVGGDK